MTNNQIILENSQANMFDGLMGVCEIMTTGITPEIGQIENRWIRQSNLIYLLNSTIASESQRTKAANELARLGMDKKIFDGYNDMNYWEGGYAQ